MKVFVDANIYLSFLRLSEEKLSTLEEFVKLVKKGKIKLVFPTITQDEVLRNIPSVARDYVKTTLTPEIKKSPPSLAVNIRGEYSKLSDLHTKYIDELKVLRDRYLDRIKKIQSEIIEPLITKAETFSASEDVIQKAIYRKHCGNPPGKKDRIGDELVWELLLTNSKKHTFAVISADSDWKDVLAIKKTELHPFLQREWAKTGPKGDIDFFGTLGSFMKKQDLIDVQETQIKAEKIAGESMSYINAYGSLPTLSTVSTSAHPGTTSMTSGVLSSIGTLSALDLPGATLKTCPECANVMVVQANENVCMFCGAFLN